MARNRKEKSADKLKLKQPDRSGPTEQTLLQMADERQLFEQAAWKQAARPTKASRGEYNEEDSLEPTTLDRVVEAFFYTISLAMLHFTLDVLVQHQYGVEVNWPQIIGRALVAFLGKWMRLAIVTTSLPLRNQIPPSSQSHVDAYFLTDPC